MNRSRAVVAFAVVLALLVLTLLAGVVIPMLCFDRWDIRGQFGDMFGATNGIASVLAVLGLVVAYALQVRQVQQAHEQHVQSMQALRTELDQARRQHLESMAMLRQQLQEAKAQKQLQEANLGFDRLNDPDALAAREAIFALSSWSDLESITNPHPEAERITRFMNYMNHVAFVMSKGFLPIHPTMEMYYITVVRMWAVLGPLILERRKKRGVYFSHFQWLAEISVAYWERHHPDTKITVFNSQSRAVRALSWRDMKSEIGSVQQQRYNVGRDERAAPVEDS